MCKIPLDVVWPFLVLIKTHLFFATKQYQRSSDIFLEDTQKLCLRDWVQHYITPVWIHVIDDWIITYWYLKFIIVHYNEFTYIDMIYIHKKPKLAYNCYDDVKYDDEYIYFLPIVLHQFKLDRKRQDCFINIIVGELRLRE